MARGKGWNDSHTNLLIMYKYLTHLSYREVAKELCRRYDWCNINNDDMRAL